MCDVLIGICSDLVVTFLDRKSTRLNSSHLEISYAVFCLKKKINLRTNLVKREPLLGLATTVQPAGAVGARLVAVVVAEHKPEVTVAAPRTRDPNSVVTGR